MDLLLNGDDELVCIFGSLGRSDVVAVVVAMGEGNNCDQDGKGIDLLF
jgi:hypothetical protein